jgi:hypothetical protein
MFLGQFKPEPGTRPAIGQPGKLEFVEEDRVEVVINDKGRQEEVKQAIKELKTVSIRVCLSWCTQLLKLVSFLH